MPRKQAEHDAAREALGGGDDSLGGRFTQIELPMSAMRAIWLGGACAVLLCIAASNIVFANKLKRTRREYLDAQDAPLRVYVSDAIPTPCLYGVFSPAIYVTPESLESGRLRHVLAHESAHFRQGDHIWALLRCLCAAVYWFDPLVWLAAALSRLDGELCCDEAAIAALGEESRFDYGRTLVGMVSRRRDPLALIRTATTMTGGKRSIAERVRLIAKKPKMAAYTLAAVLLITALAAGCTFTGAKKGLTGELVFEDLDKVKGIYIYRMGELNTVPSDSEEFREMLDWIGEFTYGEPLSWEEQAEPYGGYSVFAVYPGDKLISSGIDRTSTDKGGYGIVRPELPSCWDSLVSAGDAEGASADIDAPTAVLNYARDYVAQVVDAWNNGVNENGVVVVNTNKIIEAKITGLTPIDYAPASDVTVGMWLLEYRLLPEDQDNIVLAGGMQAELIDGWSWLTEWGSTGQPYLILNRTDDDSYERICVTNTLTMQEDYNTPEKLEQYGNMYAAAAMELYNSYLSNNTDTAKINRQIIDVLNSDGAYATMALDVLLDSLMDHPAETFEAIGARYPAICDDICWALAAHIDGIALDNGDALTVEGLSENGQYARELLWQYMSGDHEAPKHWRTVYLDFWRDELPGLLDGAETDGVGLYDPDADGVPDMAVLLPDGSAVTYYTDGERVYHKVGSTVAAGELDFGGYYLSVSEGDTLDDMSVQALLNSWRPA